MDLDNPNAFPPLDSRNLLAVIDAFPEMLQSAWDAGRSLPLPNLDGIHQVALLAEGSAVLAAEIVAACAFSSSPLPVHVVQGEVHPAWLWRADTLIFSLSPDLDIDGKIVEAHRVILPDATDIGNTLGLILAVFSRLGLIPSIEVDFPQALTVLRAQQEKIRAEVEICRNPAKRLAGQFMERTVVLVGTEFLTPAARRWKTQIKACARAYASCEDLPAPSSFPGLGTEQPEEELAHFMALFMQSPAYHPRNQARMNALHMSCMMDGINTDIFTAPGNSPLAQSLSALHFGDYCAYYLAMLYGYDPTPSNDD